MLVAILGGCALRTEGVEDDCILGLQLLALITFAKVVLFNSLFQGFAIGMVGWANIKGTAM